MTDKAREAAARAHQKQMGVLGGDPVNAAIDAYLAALKTEGFAVMPREAFDAMWSAGNDMMPSADELVAGIEEYGEAVFYEVMPGPGKIWTAMFDAYKED